LGASRRPISTTPAAGFDRIDARFDGLQRSLLQVAYGLVGVLFAGAMGLIGVVVTLIVTQ
jgi:hypothetical protein